MAIIEDPITFFKRIGGMLYFLIAEKQKFYCEECDEDLTQIGAFITYEGKIYCAHVPWCLEKAAIARGLESIEGDVCKSIDIQDALRAGTFHLPKYFK